MTGFLVLPPAVSAPGSGCAVDWIFRRFITQVPTGNLVSDMQEAQVHSRAADLGDPLRMQIGVAGIAATALDSLPGRRPPRHGQQGMARTRSTGKRMGG